MLNKIKNNAKDLHAGIWTETEAQCILCLQILVRYKKFIIVSRIYENCNCFDHTQLVIFNCKILSFIFKTMNLKNG